MAVKIISQDAVNALIKAYACNAILHSILLVLLPVFLVVLQFLHAKYVLIAPIVLLANQDIIH